MTPSPRRALLSVSDKSSIEVLGRALADRGWQIVSTGGTARRLRDAGVPVTEVAAVTGHAEMMEGRVKTLHPAVHGGLLARRDRPGDMEELAEHGYAPIDLVAVNLYPFRETVASGPVSADDAMEKVDIGGPTMIRAAAKNHRDVWVVVDPSDYGRVIEAIDVAGAPGLAEGGAAPGEAEAVLRRELAAKVFEHVSEYDRAIARYLATSDPTERSPGEAVRGSTAGSAREAEGASGDQAVRGGRGTVVAERFAPDATLVSVLRYGENPDQEAAFYRLNGGAPSGLSRLVQHHGKELSYNNLLDLDGALLCLAPFAFSSRPACCIVKHTTPAGLAAGDSLEDAYRRALRTDPVSSFGSVIAVNRAVDAAVAGAMSELFIECVVAPSFTDDALATLTRKKNIRLLTFEGVGEPLGIEPEGAAAWDALPDDEKASARFVAAQGRLPRAEAFRSVYGGVLVQTPPLPPFYGMELERWQVATERSPTGEEDDDLRFAWAAVYGVKSNAILLAKDGATLGIGAGQMSRVDSSRIAVMKAHDAGLDLAGSVLASDAFFPFRDGVDAAAEAGVRAIVQPGGSVRDQEVIEAANEHGLAMVLTGRRLFRH